MKRAILILIITLITLNGYARDRHKIDSLQNELVKFEARKKQLGSKADAITDSTKAIILDKIGKEFLKSNSDSVMYYAKQTLSLSEKIGFKKGIGNAYGSIGNVYLKLNKYSEALDYYQKSLDIWEITGNKKVIAYCYSNIAECYLKISNYPEEVKYRQLELKTDIEIGDKSATALAYYKIGNILSFMVDDYPNALKNILASMKIYEELGGKEEGLMKDYLSLDYIYCQKGNYKDALNACLKALELGEEVKDTFIIAAAYNNIGYIDDEEGKYTEAMKNYFNSLKIAEEERDRYSIVRDNIAIGVDYEMLSNLKTALNYYLKALSLSREEGAKDDMASAYGSLAGVYAKLHNYKAYYDNEILYRQMDDSINSKANQRKLTSLQMQYDFNIKQDSTRAEQVKKDAVKENEIKNQKRIRNYISGGLAIVLFFLVFVFIQRNRIAKGKKRSENLLLNILPSEVADELKAKGSAEARDFEEVTVMFTDFKDFTKISEQLTSAKLVAEINYCFSAFDAIIEKYGIEKIKTIGDSYMCAGGLPVKNITHPADVIKAALDIKEFMAQYKRDREARGEMPFEIRIGVHTGPVVAGIVGVKKFAYDIWGDTVNIASRMESSGEAGKINISGSTYELVKNDFTCIHRGKIQAKNKGEIDMYFVEERIMA